MGRAREEPDHCPHTAHRLEDEESNGPRTVLWVLVDFSTRPYSPVAGVREETPPGTAGARQMLSLLLGEMDP